MAKFLTREQLGDPIANTINNVTITQPENGATLTIADGKTLTASNTLTLTGTDGSSVALGTGGSVAYLESPTFTGTPEAPTANTGTNTTQIATTAFVQQELGAFALKTGQWIILQDQKASGTNGGTCTASTWVTRALNTEVRDPNGNCTLSSNRFTLKAGNYGVIQAEAPSYQGGFHKIALYNVTTASYVAYGSSAQASAGDNTQTESSLFFVIGTLASDTTYEIRHWTANTQATNGFGVASGIASVNEIYAQVLIEDLN